MRLQNLFPDFNILCEQEQLLFISKYREKRASDLLPKNKDKKSRIKKKSQGISLSEDDKSILKILGLTVSDVNRLKSIPDIESIEEGEEGEEREEGEGELDPGCFTDSFD